MIEDNRKVMSYKGNNNMGKNGREIKIQEGSDLPDSFVIGEHTFDRSSFFKVVFPLERAFRSRRSSVDAKVVFYLKFEGFVRLLWFKALRGMRARKAVISIGTFEHNGVLFSV